LPVVVVGPINRVQIVAMVTIIGRGYVGVVPRSDRMKHGAA
jgi:hypothetical protein